MGKDLVFYTNPMSRGRIIRWMLEETGVPYETKIVDYGDAMKAPDYLALNPMGKVPTIVHGETIVSECAAICAYLADAFPDAQLAPSLDQRGPYYRWLFFAAGPLEAATVNRTLGFDVPSERERTVGYGNFSRVMDMLEHAVTGTSYIAGEAFSAADIYVGAHVAWGLQFETIENRPAFAAYRDRVTGRPAFHRAAELDDLAMKQADE